MADAEKREQVENALINNALGPATAETDGMRVTQHNLKDQIELDRYLASKEAVKQPGGLGIILKKLSPPGTV